MSTGIDQARARSELIEALVHRLKNREAEVSDEAFASAFADAMCGHGWRMTAAARPMEHWKRAATQTSGDPTAEYQRMRAALGQRGDAS